MRVVGMLLVILGFAITVFTVSTFIEGRGRDSAAEDAESKVNDGAASVSSAPFPESRSSKLNSGLSSGPVPVALNRSSEIPNGFRGDVHPLLSGQTRLEVNAEWTPVGKGRDGLDRSVNPIVYSWFTELRSAEPKRTYTERDLSAFLPSTVRDVGQLWALDSDRMAKVLKQFHPHPSMRLIASGRRAGPDGSFALLRAVSSSYLDIVFRIHAEFFLTPGEGPPGTAPINAWYTPAYFAGRILVNQQTGTVEHFRLALPIEKELNVHLTVQAIGKYIKEAHDVVRVERMELSGGKEPAGIHWSKEIAPAEAQRRLAKVFYKSLEIDFVPCEQALALARSKDRPIFAIVSWGSFEDQSC